MNTTLFAALLALAPLAAQAAPTAEPAETYGTFTGRVKITQVMCIRAPCPPIVEIVGDDGEVLHVRGSMLRDVESLRGKEITVKGNVRGGSMDVSALAPGRSKSFVTGTVRNTTVCTRSLPPQCRYSVDIVTADGGVVKVTDEKFAKGLSQLDGATVSIKGTVTNTPCPPGRVCIQLYQPTLWPDSQANIWVKGTLENAYHIMLYQPGVEYANYFLRFPNGGQTAVFTKKNWSDRVDSEAWYSGSFDGDKFRATKAGYGMVPDPAIQPFPWSIGANDGSNVSRDASTDGAVSATPAGAQAAQGAGMLRD